MRTAGVLVEIELDRWRLCRWAVNCKCMSRYRNVATVQTDSQIVRVVMIVFGQSVDWVPRQHRPSRLYNLSYLLRPHLHHRRMLALRRSPNLMK